MLPVYCVDSFFGKNSFEKKSSSLQNEMGAFLRKVFAKWVDIFSHFEEKLQKKVFYLVFLSCDEMIVSKLESVINPNTFKRQNY